MKPPLGKYCHVMPHLLSKPQEEATRRQTRGETGLLRSVAELRWRGLVLCEACQAALC